MKNYSEEKKWLSSEDIFLAPLEEFHIKYLIKLTENQNLIKSMGWDARFEGRGAIGNSAAIRIGMQV